MELPPVAHLRRDPRTGVLYDVRAYRPLAEQEVLQHIRGYLAQTPLKKRPKRGDRITVITLIGYAR